MENVIVALITGGLALIGTAITVRSNARKNRAERKEDMAAQQAELKAELEKHEALSDAKIDALKREVEKHNSVIERTFRLESNVENLFHRHEETTGRLTEAERVASHANERAQAANNRLDRMEN